MTAPTFTISLVDGNTAARPFSGTLQDLAEKLTAHDWTPGTFSDSHRHAQSWTGTDVLAFDIDDSLSLVDAVSRLVERKLQCIVLTTRHHQKPKGKKPACDRFRVVLVLAERITDTATYEATWQAWHTDLFPEADRAAKDPARMFYRSPEIYAWEDQGDTLAVISAPAAPRSEPQTRDAAEKRLAGFPYAERLQRASTYLKAVVKKGGVAVEGARDNQTLYVARAVGWDFGLDESTCFSLLTREWNPHCPHPWDDAGLVTKIRNAYRYEPDRVFGCKLLETAELLPRSAVAPTKPGALAPPIVPPDPDQSNWTPNQLLGSTAKCLDECFRMLRITAGQETVIGLRVDERNQATAVANEKQLDAALGRHLADRYGETGVVLSDLTVNRTISLWKRHGTLLTEEPAQILFDGQEPDRLAWCRPAWSPAPGDWSAWREFSDRCSDPEAFMAYVGACFVAENETRQALYLLGDGEEGKSTVISVLETVLGVGAGAIGDIAVTKSERFLLSTIYGRRVILYGDCKLPGFCRGSAYRAIISGDTQPIEFKGLGTFPAKIRSRLIIASNFEPQIGSDPADQSRLLLIRVDRSKNTDDPTWKTRLQAQLPAFVFECLKAYARRCPRHGKITLSDTLRDAALDASLDHEAEFEEAIEKTFVLDPEAPPIPRSQVRQALRSNGFKVDDQWFGRFRPYLRQKHGITDRQRWVEGKKDRWFTGLRPRSVRFPARMPSAAGVTK